MNLIGSAGWIRRKLIDTIREEDPDAYVWVTDVFPDGNTGKAVLDDEDKGKYYEVPYSVIGDQAIFGEPREVEFTYVTKMREDAGVPGPLELTAPIVTKNAEKRIVYGPVLVPDEPDSDGDVVSKEKIEEVAHHFLKDYGNLDLQHTLNNIARPVESYITPVALQYGDMVVPKGSWMMGAYIDEDESWERAKKGELTGFSIMGVRKTKISAKSQDVAYKRTLLRDLGDDWVAPYVSLVDTPAVPKAKWVAIKSEGLGKPGMLEKLTGLFSTQKEGRKFSNSNYNKIKAAADALTALVEEAEKERASKKSIEEEAEMNKEETQAMVKEAMESHKEIAEAAIKEAVSEVVTTLSERLEKVEGSVEKSEPKDDNSDQGPSGDMESLKAKVEELESFRLEVAEKLKAKPDSKAIKGQDGEEEDTAVKNFGGRDGFGRAIKSE